MTMISSIVGYVSLYIVPEINDMLNFFDDFSFADYVFNSKRIGF